MYFVTSYTRLVTTLRLQLICALSARADLASLYLSSGTVRAAAGAGRAFTAPPTEHIVYTSDEGPPDEEPVPVLMQHPVHGPEVRGWRTRNGTRSALSRDIAHLPELEESHSYRLQQRLGLGSARHLLQLPSR